MKTCALCGETAEVSAETCASCGEGTFVDAAPVESVPVVNEEPAPVESARSSKKSRR